MTAAQFARHLGVAPGTLAWWRWRIERGDDSLARTDHAPRLLQVDLLHDDTHHTSWVYASPDVRHARDAGSQPTVGDFDNDGTSDIALAGGAGWASVPIAFSSTRRRWTTSNHAAIDLPAYAAQAGARLIAGRFNRDGRSDLALVGGGGWDTVPVGLRR